ncbi:MAG TPA: prephenate dehydratase [Acidimicrobiales bacterium]|nr:prephenate dehydratase [Acidimicrobiales bacterium]
MNPPATSVAYFGPAATFTQEALLTQPDLSAAETIPLGSITAVLEAVAGGRADLGFVPMENAIEGTVSATIDGLIHDVDLHIQREVVMDIHLHLMVRPGTSLADIRSVASYPHALAQCQKFLARELPGVEQRAANSTADAARVLGESGRADEAAIAPRLAAERYGLTVVAEDVEDHPENQTRFVLVARSKVPGPTGHDKTSIVCFQRADHPGSLHGILGQFAARNINLTKLESRPTKQGLGDYCFVIDLSGHIGDEVVADCLRDLHASLAGVKFLGSYPAAGEHGPEQRRQADAAWQAADDWLRGLRGAIE